MDLLTILVAFLTGTLTGAAGNYLADKYTDARREKKETAKMKKLWNEIESRFPEIIKEMRADTYSFTSEPCFEYYTDKHPELRAAALHLAHHGFIQDITPGNTPMYRINEKLVDFLRATN